MSYNSENIRNLILEAMFELLKSSSDEDSVICHNLNDLNEIFINFSEIIKLGLSSTDKMIAEYDCKRLIKFNDYYITIYIDISYNEYGDENIVNFRLKRFLNINNAWTYYNSLK